MSIYAVIMAGGRGTRFWPLSREQFPKQFLRIFGSQSMIEETVSRILPLIPSEDIYIVTNHQYAEEIRLKPPFIREKCNFILEPVGKNTAPALGLAAIYLKNRDPEGVMLALPSDHVIKDNALFLKVLEEGESIARSGYLVTIGIKPVRPETGYGYIKFKAKGSNFKAKDGKAIEAYEVERFIEKPSLFRARRYVKAGDYLWNSGIFIWKVSTFLEEIRQYMPELSEGLKVIEGAIGQEGEKEVVANVYSQLKPQSVDYGVLEKSKKVMVIPSHFGWNDVGSWKAMDDIMEKDGHGNIIEGNVINIDSSDSIIYGGRRLLATLGLNNTIVVDTEDATLVCSKEKAQDVKKVVEELKRRGSEEYLTHRTVYRPWGSYTVLEKGEGFKVKMIVVNPKSRLSLQSHKFRSEHWVVVSGRAKVTIDDKVFYIGSNESTFVPKMTRHRLENVDNCPLNIIEVQCGSYVEEDDIERYEDDYGRDNP